jgi:murein DD-endopeptidase MepM/ murein hydrolase activator NlpD
MRAVGLPLLMTRSSSVADGLKDGSVVMPGEIVGYSGGDHLHFEIRPAPSADGEKSFFVINPLTFFAPELQAHWVAQFASDYNIPGDTPF